MVKKVDQTLEEGIAELHRRGFNQEMIAKMLGTNQSRVSRYLKRLKGKTMSQDIDLGSMSTEQLAELQARVEAKLRDTAVQPRETSRDSHPPTPHVEGDYVFTNIRNAALIIPDLGRGQGKAFEAETFNPYECKNLLLIYSAEELDKSKYLKKFISLDKVLIPGRHSNKTGERDKWGTELWDLSASMTGKVEVDPLTSQARMHAKMDGAFPDPNKNRPYDEALEELERKDREQDDQTRRR